eukprot:TRINITY_DN11209_c0_g1_i3.p2 TRINITY_DN11209_c0_g1~~TRINITY_DN11209_c0_g1_i3.p2  ORF type:complete len:140 (+),score=14.36 TRINITY_DN11209_c0_g1_i3:281-700(+)
MAAPNPPPLALALNKEDYGKILTVKENQLLRGQENYTSWSIYMRAVLYEARCIDHVLPPTGQPREARPPPNPAPARIQWDHRDRADIVAITTNLHASQHPYVRGNDSSAADLWDFFASMYRHKDGQHRGLALTQWQKAE